MAQISPPTGKKPVAKPAGNPADRNFFSGSAVPIAPRTAPTVSVVRPTGPAPAAPAAFAAAPSMGRAMTVASPNALTLAKNLRINPNNPTAASSIPYVQPQVNKPTWGDNLVTGGLRYLMDPAIDATLGMFPLTAPFAIPASAAAASYGENLAQQWELGRNLRTEKDPIETALAGSFGMVPFAAGTAARVGKSLMRDNKHARTATANYFQRLIDEYIVGIRVSPSERGYLPESLAIKLREQEDFKIAREAGKIGEDPRLTGDTEYFTRNLPSEIKVYSPEELDAQSRGSEKFRQWLARQEQEILANVQREFKQPIAINLPSENAAKVLVDGFFKNVHYPGVRSQGFHEPFGRGIYEEAVFDIPNPGASGRDPSKHPIYGYSMWPGGSDYRNAFTYGNTTFVLDDAIKNRSFATLGDTGGMGQQVQPVEFGSTDIRNIRSAVGAKSNLINSYNWSNPHDYTEAQIMGGVTLDDVRKIIYKPKEDSFDPGDVELRKLLAQLQIPYEIAPRKRRW